MYVREVMSSPAVVATPDTPVKHAAGQLAENAFTSLPVIDPDGGLVGVVNEADLLWSTGSRPIPGPPGRGRRRPAPAPRSATSCTPTCSSPARRKASPT